VVEMLIVVRHAVAVDRADWIGDDLLRPLTPLGEQQAEGLVVRLQDHPIERILSSPALRCTQTVEPLARRRLVPVEAFAPLGLDVPTEELLEELWRDDLHDVVLCAHGETISEVLTLLSADGHHDAESLQWPKGSTWLLQRLPQREVRGRYLPPPPTEPAPGPGQTRETGDRVGGAGHTP
jgi:phosphohistidine phosphatase SixA